MSNNEMVSVPPCPFCGKQARYIPADYVDQNGQPWPFAECNPCNVGAPVEFWNKRTLPAEPVPTVFTGFDPGLPGGDHTVPPAGGEPEVKRVIDRLNSSDPEFQDCEDAVSLITRLQAEVERLTQLAIDRKNGQTELCTEISRLTEELEALKAAQGVVVNQVRSHGSCCWEDISGESLELVRSQPEEYEVRTLYAAPPQGEPVTRKSDKWSKDWKEQGFNYCIETAIKALKYLADNPRPIGGESRYNAEHLIMTAQELVLTRQELLIGREQPAPVAVVLPVRYESNLFPKPYRDGWNACLDEVARINGIKSCQEQS